ncbi:uncharacterized protein LOC108485160 [Gossypium arboreum]|uniref:uncharacterized protein LOC108485160 n=1 Tax=Gossypium arboreum TaxID=29729 RepID=UPI0008193D16|nr:uncharacterized protein LOC108485160 [Gossypium arboreum]
MEHCKAITLRNRTQLSDVVHDAAIREDNTSNNQVNIPEPYEKQTTLEKGKQQNVVVVPDHDVQFKRFLEVLKQLHINIPLVKALEQMPSYVKFMKDILSKKRRLGEFDTAALIKGCTTMLMYKLPPKLKDPRSFTIPCSIGMHYVDFLILECEADHDVPIILGRLFLATSRTLIDVQKSELTMRVNDQQVTFNVFNALKCLDENEECHTIGLIEGLVDKFAKFCYSNFDNEDDLTEQGDKVFEELKKRLVAALIVVAPK